MKTLKDIQQNGELEVYMSGLGAATAAILPSTDGSPANRVCFVLLVADPESDQAHYVSNARRADCVKWLRETADRLEAREDTPLQKPGELRVRPDLFQEPP